MSSTRVGYSTRDKMVAPIALFTVDYTHIKDTGMFESSTDHLGDKQRTLPKTPPEEFPHVPKPKVQPHQNTLQKPSNSRRRSHSLAPRPRDPRPPIHRPRVPTTTILPLFCLGLVVRRFRHEGAARAQLRAVHEDDHGHDAERETEEAQERRGPLVPQVAVECWCC